MPILKKIDKFRYLSFQIFNLMNTQNPDLLFFYFFISKSLRNCLTSIMILSFGWNGFGQVTVSAISGNTTEAGGTATFSVSLTSMPTADVTVALSSNTPTEGTVPASVTINSTNWNTGVPVTVTGLDDNVVDGPINYNIITGDVTSLDASYNGILGASIADVLVTNNDNDSATISITPNTVINEGNVTVRIAVTLSGAVANPFAVNYATANQTAMAGSDYTAKSGVLNFLGTNGEVQTIEVTIRNDIFVESNETFQINLSNLTGIGAIGIANAQGLVSITDNDAANLIINDVTVNENAGTATFTITLSGTPLSGFTVNYTTSDGTALAGRDYQNITGFVTFDGQNAETRTIDVPIIDDTVYESPENFVVTLSGANDPLVTIVDSQGFGVILDDEPCLLDNSQGICDTDGDGIRDEDELAAGTNPFDPCDPELSFACISNTTDAECKFLFNQFSPNGDGINDYLVIELSNCTESYPNINLEIFDRYGNQVYKAKGYDNTWDGTNKNGDLPKGTYYYILDFGDASPIAKGWIQIIR